MFRYLFLFVFAVCLAGCASGYEKFYQSVPVRQTASVLPFTGEPQIISGGPDVRQTVLQMYENGYVAIGMAGFVGPAEDPGHAIAQAKKVGAAIVVISTKYQSTVSGSIPLTLPTTTTSHTSGTAQVTGSGGYATGTYSGTTTTYGTQTTNIPYSIDRYQQVAVFFAPLERKGIGIFMAELTPAQRQQLGSNRGVAIEGVRKGSPAFLADVLPGDILLSIDGQPTYDAETAMRGAGNALGHDVKLLLARDGRRLTKVVSVPAGTW